MRQTAKLTIDLIPSTMWGKNVRKVISKQNWEEFRYTFGATVECPSIKNWNLPVRVHSDKVQCSICGISVETMELHETWQFDDKKQIQRLTGLIPLCSNCHLSIHLGRAYQIGKAEKAVEHLQKVNGWNENQVQKHIASAMGTWQKRSSKKYILDLSWLEQWLPKTQIHLDWLDAPRWAGDRIEAIQWAQDLLKSKAVILDTETTGLLEKRNVEIIELTIINMKGKVLYQSRFRPRYNILKSATKIHGMVKDDLKNEPTFKEEFSKIFNLLNSKIVVAYNKRFDQSVLERTCKIFKIDPPECQWECAMIAYRAFQEAGHWLKLPEAKHNSLDDCKATLKLLKLMAKG